jgi:triacylglycerol lipase
MDTTSTTFKDLTEPGEAVDFFGRRKFPPFEPDAKGFSAANALWLMELSRLVYRRDVEEGVSIVPPRSSFLRNAGLEQVEFFNKTDLTADTQGMLVRSIEEPRWAALVFRGSEKNVKDWLGNLMMHSVPVGGEGVRVHEGFEHALEIVWEKVAEALATLGDVPLFFTGHSLGAALATIAASRHAPRAVYTFGSPLVGNHHFAEALKDVAIYRIVDDIDAVTFAPPPFLGYLHVGEEKKLSEAPRPPFYLFAEKPFFDHAPVNYVDRLVI